MNKGIVLLSGGMDSCVTLAIARGECEVYPLHVNYRHLTEKKELESFRSILRHYDIKRNLIVDIDYLRKIGGSALLDPGMPLEEGSPRKEEIPSSYVPFRNTHLLAIAVSWAEALDASRIYIGAVAEDSSGYPDTRPEYIEAFNNLVKLGTKKRDISVVAPLVAMSKKEIVLKGVELGAPFEHTWSCYSDNDEACGKCQSCYLRMRAFREAGVNDPIKYSKGK